MSDNNNNDCEGDSESEYEELEKANVAETPDKDPRKNDDGGPSDGSSDDN